MSSASWLNQKTIALNVDAAVWLTFQAFCTLFKKFDLQFRLRKWNKNEPGTHVIIINKLSLPFWMNTFFVRFKLCNKRKNNLHGINIYQEIKGAEDKNRMSNENVWIECIVTHIIKRKLKKNSGKLLPIRSHQRCLLIQIRKY